MMAVDMSVVTDVCIWGRKSWKPTEHNKEIIVMFFTYSSNSRINYQFQAQLSNLGMEQY